MKIIIGLLLSFGVVFSSVDINHASVDELTTLKGIGKAKALKIVDYVKQNGCFKNLDDIVKVNGVSTKTLLKNKDNIKIVSCEKK